MIITGGVLNGGVYQDQAQVINAGLVFNLDASNPASYPGSGSTWTDTVGALAFNLINNPTYTPSNGGAIVFDPASSQYADGPSLASSLSTWTAETWLYHDATNMGVNGSPCIVTELY